MGWLRSKWDRPDQLVFHGFFAQNLDDVSLQCDLSKKVRLGIAKEFPSALFGGRKVDLRTLRDLSPYFREEVLREAEVQYAEE